MSRSWVADVRITLKPSVNDPQGQSIQGALAHLGFEQVEGVRMGKFIQVRLRAEDAAGAEEAVRAMCEKLLANPVVEDFRVSEVQRT